MFTESINVPSKSNIITFLFSNIFLFLILKFFKKAIKVETAENVSKNIPAYDLYIIAYTIQHNAEIIPEILIVFSLLIIKETNTIVEAIIGNMEKIFSYVNNDININNGIVESINTFLFLLLCLSKKYIIIIIKRLIKLQTVAVIPPNK